MESEKSQSADNQDANESQDSDEVINFYGSMLPFYEFSNFFPAELYIDSKMYPTSEHYFQSMKFFPHEKIMAKVRFAKSPGIAAKLGRDRSLPLRADWEEVKDDIMYEALYAKFTQNSSLKDVLLSTGDKLIVEHTKNDFYWGDGGDGSGKNMLGTLIMKLRSELKLV